MEGSCALRIIGNHVSVSQTDWAHQVAALRSHCDLLQRYAGDMEKELQSAIQARRGEGLCHFFLAVKRDLQKFADEWFMTDEQADAFTKELETESPVKQETPSPSSSPPAPPAQGLVQAQRGLVRKREPHLCAEAPEQKSKRSAASSSSSSREGVQAGVQAEVQAVQAKARAAAAVSQARRRRDLPGTPTSSEAPEASPRQLGTQHCVAEPASPSQLGTQPPRRTALRGGSGEGGSRKRGETPPPPWLQAWAPQRAVEQKPCQCSGHCGNPGHRYWQGCDCKSRVISSRSRRCWLLCRAWPCVAAAAVEQQ